MQEPRQGTGDSGATTTIPQDPSKTTAVGGTTTGQANDLAVSSSPPSSSPSSTTASSSSVFSVGGGGVVSAATSSSSLSASGDRREGGATTSVAQTVSVVPVEQSPAAVEQPAQLMEEDAVVVSHWEQKFNEMESRVVTAEGERDDALAQLVVARTESQQHSSMLLACQKALEAQKQETEKLAHSLNLITKEKESQNQELKLLTHTISRKDSQLESNREELKLADERIAALTSTKTQLESKYMQLESSSSTLKLKLDHLENEAKILTQEIEASQKQMESKSQELLEEKKLRAGQVAQLEAKLRHLVEQKEFIESELKATKNHSQKLQASTDKYEAQILQLNNDMEALKRQYDGELIASNKKYDIVKEQRDTCLQKISHLNEQISALTSLLEQARNEHNAAVSKAEEALEKLHKENESLKKKIETPKDVLDPIEFSVNWQEMSGASIDDWRVFSMNLQSKYEESVRLFHREKQLRNNAEICLNFFCKELETNAPSLSDKLLENKELKEKVSDLTEAQALSVSNLSDLQQQLSRKELDFVALKSVNRDLSDQIAHLLETCTEKVNSMSTTNTSSQISFSDIQSLQEKNQQLLLTVHRLTQEKETILQKLPTDKQTDSVKELAKMREEMEKALQREDTLRKQCQIFKDLYETLLLEHKKCSLVMPSEPCIQQSVYDTLKKDFDEYRDHSTTTLQQMKKECEDLQQLLNSANLDLTKVHTQVDLYSVRNAHLKDENDKMKSEVEELRAQNTKLTESLEALSKKSHEREAESVYIRQEVKSLKVINTSLLREKADLKESCQQWQTESEQLRSEISRLSASFSSLTSSRAAADAVAIAERKRLENDLEKANKKIIEYQRHLEESRSTTEATLGTLTRQLQEKTSSLAATQSELEMKEEQLKKMLDSQKTFEARFQSVQQELEACKKTTPHDPLQLALLKNEIANWKDFAEREKAISKSNKDMAESAEKRRAEVAQLLQKQQVDSNLQLTTYQSKIAELEERSKKREEETQSYIEEKKALQSRVDALQSNVHSLESEIKQFQSQLANKSEAEKLLQVQLHDMELAKNKLQISYEDEVKARGRDLENISKIRADLAHFTSLYESLHTQADTWREQELDYQKRIDTLTSITETPAYHKDTVQMDQITKDFSMKGVPSSIAGVMTPRTNEELQAVVEWLRKEKCLSDCQKEELEQRNKRLQSDISIHLSEVSKLKETTRQLESKLKLFPSVEEFQEMKNSLQQVELFKESNVTLRKGKQSLEEEIILLKNEIAALKCEKDSFDKLSLNFEAQVRDWKTRCHAYIDKMKPIEENNASLLEEIAKLKEQCSQSRDRISTLEVESSASKSQLLQAQEKLRQQSEARARPTSLVRPRPTPDMKSLENEKATLASERAAFAKEKAEMERTNNKIVQDAGQALLSHKARWNKLQSLVHDIANAIHGKQAIVQLLTDPPPKSMEKSQDILSFFTWLSTFVSQVLIPSLPTGDTLGAPLARGDSQQKLEVESSSEPSTTRIEAPTTSAPPEPSTQKSTIVNLKKVTNKPASDPSMPPPSTVDIQKRPVPISTPAPTPRIAKPTTSTPNTHVPNVPATDNMPTAVEMNYGVPGEPTALISTGHLSTIPPVMDTDVTSGHVPALIPVDALPTETANLMPPSNTEAAVPPPSVPITIASPVPVLTIPTTMSPSLLPPTPTICTTSLSASTNLPSPLESSLESSTTNAIAPQVLEHGVASPLSGEFSKGPQIPEEETDLIEGNEDSEAALPKRTREEAGLDQEVSKSKRKCTTAQPVTPPQSGIASPTPEEKSGISSVEDAELFQLPPETTNPPDTELPTNEPEEGQTPTEPSDAKTEDTEDS
ncbi:nucleoprotein TPR [Pelomyxa schiedti]|nr:nucleoprotein TPR [Pelomyxa schiedti]